MEALPSPSGISMTPEQFLQSVWPEKDQGFYVLAVPTKSPSTGRTVFSHKVFDTIAEASAFVASNISKPLDFYFGIHTLKERRVFNPQKLNYKTNEKGAYEIRTQANSNRCKCFILDLDVDLSGGNDKKYASQADALAGLRTFCKAANLPKPMVASSGGGLHVYWIISDPLPAAEWRIAAHQLRALTDHYGLKADPSRTTDSASVLRVAGTYNWKQPDNPRQVQVLISGVTTTTTHFLGLLTTAVTEVGARVSRPSTYDPDLDDNIEDWTSGPKVSVKALAEACPTFQEIVRQKGMVDEPTWYHTLNLVRFLDKGEKLVHKVSEGHPNYSPDDTERKVDQLRSKGIKPTSCHKLAEVAGDAGCQRCLFRGQVKSPLVAARLVETAPPPQAVVEAGAVVHTLDIPNPPKPFSRTAEGKIGYKGKNKNGDEVFTVIYENDLYPVLRYQDIQERKVIERQIWRTVIPKAGNLDFTLPAEALYDKRLFMHTLSNCGIFPHPGNVNSLMEYMVAYIAELQKLAKAETQNNYLGWTDNFTSFVLPDRILHADGSATRPSLSSHVATVSEQARKSGSLHRQLELLKFYNNPGYVAQQFFIFCGLAAPLYYMTGHHGAVVNASGETGSSKSTALYTAISFWGHPQLLAINGTNKGGTANFRTEQLAVFASLPIGLDEITHVDPKEAKEMVMHATQPNPNKRRLDRQGEAREAVVKFKSNIMMTTSNASLHALLSNENTAGTAGSMRVFEIPMRPLHLHEKADAEDYMYELSKNFGHIGEIFIAHIVQRQDEIEKRVRDTMRALDTLLNVSSGERFWVAVGASALVAGEIAYDLGLLPYDVDNVRKWLTEVQFPQMRGVINAEYATPISILTDYISHINGDIVVTSSGAASGLTADHQPNRSLLGHYDRDDGMLWLLKKNFRDYCTKIGANYINILESLHTPTPTDTGSLRRIVTNTNTRKVLGAGTPMAKAQVWCFSVNMSHSEIAGATSKITTPAHLKVV